MYIIHFLVYILNEFQNRDYKQKMEIKAIILHIMKLKKYRKHSFHIEYILHYDEHEYTDDLEYTTAIKNDKFILMQFFDQNDSLDLHHQTTIQ